MLKLVALILMMGFSFIGKSQTSPTKQGTEKWILSKFSTYSSKKYTYHGSGGGSFKDPIFGPFSYVVQNLSFSFEGQYLVADYAEIRDKVVTIYKVSIPVYNIEGTYCDNESLLIITKDETMIENDLTNGKKSVKKYFSFYFQCKAETDISDRIEKALLHLKKYYKKPSTNELF